MAGMPYVMEKGPVFSVYEDYVSSLQRRLALLESVSDVTVPMWDVLALDSKSLGGNPQALKDHTRDDWHGNPSWDQTTGTWKQIPGEMQTGDWIRWVGPAESILRQSFNRAIEVSLGIEHKPIQAKPGGTLRHPSPTQLHPTPGPLQRCWPIEILCAAARRCRAG